MIDEVSVCNRVYQGEGNIVSDMDGEKVMLSTKNGKYYNLGKLGGEIWEIIQTPIQINVLINILMNLYEVDFKECQKDVISFLNKLYDEGLIQVEEV